MKKSIIIAQSKILAGLLILMLYSCSEKKWDEYYVKPDYLKQGSVMDVLAGNSDYSEFSNLLRQTGYDSLLRKNENFTVFAVKNGSLGAVSGISDVVALKRIVGMHIIRSLVYKDKMANNSYLSASGKQLQFSLAANSVKVNGIVISSFDNRVFNGVVHGIDGVILALPMIYDYVRTRSNLSYFKSFIDSSFVNTINKRLNTVIGYDSLSMPIWKLPITYTPASTYMSLTRIDKEDSLTTIFLPTKTALNNLYAKMLAANGGNVNLIIPKIPAKHGDTIFRNFMLPKNTAYAGDSAVLLDYLYRNVVVRKKVTTINSGDNLFTNVAKNQFVVNKNQVVADSTLYASNGIVYSLNDVTLPDYIYNRPFTFVTEPKIVPDPNFPTVKITNPNIIYRYGTDPAPVETVSAAAYGGKYTTFSFRAIGDEIDFVIPYVNKGTYAINIKVYVISGGSLGGIMNFYYGGKLITEFKGSSYLSQTIRIGDIYLPKISVAASGPITLTFSCVTPSQSNNIQFPWSAILLTPVAP